MAPKRKSAKSKAVPKETAKEELKEEVQDVASAPVEEEKDAAEEKPPSSKKARTEQTTQKKKAGAKKGRGKPAAKNKPVVTPKAAPTEATKPELRASISSKVIIIEASKECSSFKVRAAKVESGLKEAVPALEVKINPEKPRRGCFEIRDGEGTVFISLQKMPRPFTKMKNLDLDKAIEEIAHKIK